MNPIILFNAKKPFLMRIPFGFFLAHLFSYCVRASVSDRPTPTDRPHGHARGTRTGKRPWSYTFGFGVWD